MTIKLGPAGVIFASDPAKNPLAGETLEEHKRRRRVCLPIGRWPEHVGFFVSYEDNLYWRRDSSGRWWAEERKLHGRF